MNKLSTAILRTITWFDVIGFPITAWEVFKYLNIDSSDKVSFQQINQVLSSSDLNNKINSLEGFYFLAGHEENVKKRKVRYLLAERKFKKAKRVVRILRYIPWIKMISVCNTLGYSNAPDDSDIDLFIIVEQNKLWTTRFFVISFLKFFGLRPLLTRFGNLYDIRKDRIDANFFLSDANLSIENLKIDQDVYLAYWLILQTPIYDPYNIYGQFVGANDWIKKWLPNFVSNLPSYRRRLSKPNPLVTSLLRFLNPGEKIYKKLQLKILPKHLKSLANKNTNVVINENMLKFHDQDRRVYFRDLWLKNLPTQDI